MFQLWTIFDRALKGLFKNKWQKSGSVKFKNYPKQLAVPLKIYVDFECNVTKVKSSDISSDRSDNVLYIEKCQSQILGSFSYNIVCTNIKLSKPIVILKM